MFEPFSAARLESVLARYPVSPEGRRFIDLALDKPSRNVQGTTKNVAGDMPCPKMMWTSQTESWSNEDPFTLKHIFDQFTIGYVNQVPTIYISYKGRNGRTVRAPYTGDCLRFDSMKGVVVEEYKPAADRKKLDEKYPGKYTLLDNGNHSSEVISNALKPLGIKFALRFSDEVSLTSHRNRRLLYTYLQPKAYALYSNGLKEVLDPFKDVSGHTISALLELGVNLDALNWAIAHGHLHVDLDAHLLSVEKEKAYVFRDRETLVAWSLAIRPDGSKPASDREFEEYEFTPGDELIVDGQRLTVSLAGSTALHVKNAKNEIVILDYELLSIAHKSGKVTLQNRKHSQSGNSAFWRASPSAIEKAIKSLEVVHAYDRKEIQPTQLEVSFRTIRRHKQLIRQGETLGLSPVESLIDKSNLKGFRGPHIDSDLSEKIDSWILEALSNRLNKSKISIYSDVEAMVEAIGKQMISKSSFYERVNKLQSLKTIRKSQGHKNAYQLSPSYWMLDVSTPIHCERALELVHFDSTLVDIELRSSISGEVLGRPWLSIAVCAHSRRVVGMHLSFKPPSYLSSMMLLADIVKRTGYVPDGIIHDWGSEFKSKDFKYALSALFIKRYIRAKSAPKFGSILERMFGVVTTELVANIAGNTKARKNVRQLSRSADPTTHSGLWLADLYEGLENYFFSIYDSRKHSTTLRTPKELYDATLISFGLRPHRMHKLDDIMPILMPVAKGRPRKIDPARGVFVNYRYYGHPQLTDLSLKGTALLVKPIPFDPGSIFAYLKGEWLICKTGLHEDIRSAPELIRRCLFEEWSIEKRLVEKEGDLNRRKLRILMDQLNQKAIDNKEYFKDRDVQSYLGDDSFAEATPISSSASALDALNRMMTNAVAKVIANPSAGKLMEA